MSLLTRFHRRSADSAHARAVEPLQRLKHAELLRPEQQTPSAARYLATNRFCTPWVEPGRILDDTLMAAVGNNPAHSSFAPGVCLRDGEGATAEQIRSFWQGEIAHYKIPRYGKFVGGFPMTVAGKIQKFLMRQQMIDEIGLSLQETA
jgi:hypothetical protein